MLRPLNEHVLASQMGRRPRLLIPRSGRASIGMVVIQSLPQRLLPLVGVVDIVALLVREMAQKDIKRRSVGVSEHGLAIAEWVRKRGFACNGSPCRHQMKLTRADTRRHEDRRMYRNISSAYLLEVPSSRYAILRRAI